jgi:hypothetical protein
MQSAIDLPQLQTTRTKPPEPLPSDPLGQRLCQLFPYRWHSIIAPTPAGKEKPDWITENRYPLRPSALWKLWQDAARLVGVRFDNTTQYGLIDIDATSQYLTPEWISRIKAALETIGICRVIIIRSSWNGGIHLYLPLPKPIATWKLALALKQCLLAQGFTIAAGQLELFPNCKPWGNSLKGQYTQYQAHRLPLQPGSGSLLLNSDLQPLSGDLAQFFHHWDQAAAAQDFDILTAACEAAKANHKGKYRPRKQDAVDSWRTDLETEISEGWSGHGQTNHLLKTIACYGVVFEGLSGDALAEYVQRIAITRVGYEQWCRHQHEISLRSQVWANAVANYYWSLGAERKREGNIHSPTNNIVPFNQELSEQAQSRIKAAMQELEAQHTLPSSATERGKAIIQQAHVSSRTLYKYLELWHPQHLPVQPCKTDVAASISDPQPTQPIDPPNPSESRQDKELYTSPYMKGKGAAAAENCLPSAKADPNGGSGGLSTGTPGIPAASLDPLPPDGSASNPSLPAAELRDASGYMPIKDLSEITMQIQLRVRQLGWTKVEMDEFMGQHFGGRRRSQLADDELVLLLYRLQSWESDGC